MASFKEYSMLFSLNAKTESGFQSAFSTGSAEVAKLQGTINQLNKTQADISAYQKQQAAIEKTKQRIERYQYELNNLKAAIPATSKEEKELANAIAAKDNQLKDSEKALSGQEKKLAQMGDALRQAGVNTDNLSTAQGMLTEKLNATKKAQEEATGSAQSLNTTMQGLSSILVAIGAEKALQTLYNGLKECSQNAAEFETSMASVKRTVGGDDAFISQLGDSFQELSTQMPITASELAAIATTAGQLGIAQDEVEGFTKVMAQLATTTDLSADSAATMLAQFANITGTTDYDRLGATVAALGDSTATTASKVVEMSQGLAAAANLAGMSERDILAISAAVGSLGIEAASGSTSMSQLITTLYKATETGDNLEQFASVAGMSAQQFKNAWGADAVGAMNSFIQGLNDVERNGKSAVVILDELGINNVRQVKAILGLASAGDLLTDTIAQANTAWTANTALTDKAGIMYNTTGAKLSMLQNSANNVSIAIGDTLNPVVGDAAELLTGIVQPIADFISANPALVKGLTASAGALGVVTAAVAAYEAKTKLAAIATKVFGTAVSGHFGAILAIAGGIGAVVTAIGLLSGAGKDAGASFQELQAEYESLSDSIEENEHVIDLVQQYKQLSKEVQAIENIDPEEIKLKATIENSGVTQENLKLIDELKARIDNETGEIKQILSISGAENVTQDNLSAITSLANTCVDGDHALKQALEIVGAKNVTDEDIKQIKDLANNSKDGDHTLKQTLSLLGADDISPLDLKTIKDLANASVDGDHALKQQLALIGVENISDDDMKRLKELANAVVTNSGTLSETLQLTGFESYEDMKKASELPLSSKTANIIVNLKEEGYQNVSDKLADIGEKVIAAKNDLSAAQTAMTELQGKAGELQEAINNTKSWEKKKRNGLEEELAGVNEQIEAQEEVIQALESTHESLVSQYEATTAAAQEVKDKEDALAATKRELATAIGGVVTGTEEEVAALYEQAEAAAEVDNAMKRQQLYKNLGQQATKYAQATAEAAKIQAEYKDSIDMVNVAQQFAGKSAEEINQHYRGLLQTLDQMQSAEGFDPMSADYQSTIDQVEALQNMFQGYSEDLNQYAGEAVSWVDSFAYLSTNEDHWMMTLERMNASVVEYKKSLDGATTTQNDFLDSIADSVLSGAVPIEEVERRLTEAWKDEENAAELVAGVVDYVNGKLAAQAAEAKAAAAANQELADSGQAMDDASVKQAKSVEETVKKIEDLKKAYEEAYQAAYDSIGGQFSLFEKIKEIKPTQSLQRELNNYKAGLESQTKYMKDYAANYESVAKAVEKANPDVSASFMSQLSDGSAESAQILANLAKAAPQEVESIVSAYADAQAERAKFAADIAETQTSFSETMAGLQEELSATVQAMDFSSTAAANAKTSLDAFIETAAAYVGPAKTAYKKVAAAAAEGLRFNPSLMFPGGYASGTKSAEPGVKLVGEEGPELVVFKGGEKVLNAQETQKALNAEPLKALPISSGRSEHPTEQEKNRTYNVNVTIPSINAEGMKAGELMQAIAEDLKDTIISTMEEYEEDNERASLRA